MPWSSCFAQRRRSGTSGAGATADRIRAFEQVSAAIPHLASNHPVSCRPCSNDTVAPSRAPELWTLARQLLDICRTLLYRTLPLPGDLGRRSIASLSGCLRTHLHRPRGGPAPGVRMSNPLAQDRSGHGARSDSASRDPFSIPERSQGEHPGPGGGRRAHAARELRQRAPDGWLQRDAGGPGRGGARHGQAPEVRHHPGRSLHVADLGTRHPAGRAAGLQGHDRRRDDRQPQRHQQHRGAPGRGLGLPAQAVQRHPSPGAHRPGVARGHDVARGAGPPGPAHEAERPQRQDRPDRDLAARSARRSSWPARWPRPTPRSSSAARAGPARRSSPSSSTRTAGARAGRWCRSTARRCPSRCSRARCSATGRAPSPGPTGTSPACSRPPTAAPCSSTS